MSYLRWDSRLFVIHAVNPDILTIFLLNHKPKSWIIVYDEFITVAVFSNGGTTSTLSKTTLAITMMRSSVSCKGAGLSSAGLTSLGPRSPGICSQRSRVLSEFDISYGGDRRRSVGNLWLRPSSLPRHLWKSILGPGNRTPILSPRLRANGKLTGWPTRPSGRQRRWT